MPEEAHMSKMTNSMEVHASDINERVIGKLMNPLLQDAPVVGKITLIVKVVVTPLPDEAD